MLTLLLAGGLGNQMFQYAFARSLSLCRQDKIRISRRFFRVKDSAGRAYSLNNLNISKDVELMTKSQEFFTGIKFYIARKIPGHHKGFYNDKYIYFREYDRYEPEIMRPDYGSSEIIIDGLFQSAKYFRTCLTNEKLIRNELKVSHPPSPENQTMINELNNCESVCVHVRRGDYLTLKFGQVCSYEYYERAINFIAGKIKSPVFYFFSNTHNDIKWLKDNWHFSGVNVKYVDLDNPDYEELRLMYSCRHFIIANSTLSWWGSYLSDNPDKIICAPSKWVDDRPTEQTNIYLPEWRIIK